MNEREKVLTLNRIAFLDALILSFLGIQFVIPFAFILLLIIIPTIFALQFYHVPSKQAILSGFVLILLAFSFFGYSIALWEILYFVVGGVVGFSRRYHMPIVFRMLLATILFGVCIVMITISFGLLARVSWQDIINVIAPYPLLIQLPWIPTFFLGISFWAILLSMGVENLFSRVIKQLYVGKV